MIKKFLILCVVMAMFSNNILADKIEETKLVSVVIKFNVKEASLDSFQTLMESVKTNLPLVEGCNSVDIFNSVANPNVFTVIESWDSKALHKQHIDGLIESGSWEEIANMLEKDPDSDYFKQI